MRLLQLSCDLQTLNLARIYCHTNLNFVHINFLCLSQVIFQDFLLKDQFPVPVVLYWVSCATLRLYSSNTASRRSLGLGRTCRGVSMANIEVQALLVCYR